MDETEPPSDTGETKTSTALLKKRDSSKQDLEGILLEPNPDLNELAVLNPSLYQNNNEGPWPFIYRTEIPGELGRHSIIDFRLLETPTQLSEEKRTIIWPTKDYEWRGCEDPRLTKVKDTYYITYIAFDGINTRIALATTKDFKIIEKQGIIGPQIPLEEAIGLVGNETYKKIWLRDFKASKKRLKNSKTKKEIYLWDKDAILDYNEETSLWELSHRLDPNSHIARAKDWREFLNQEYWKEQIENIDQYTSIKNKYPWATRKIGWGSPRFKLGDKYVILLHGVNKKATYRGTFCEIKNGKIVSIITDPLLQPKKDDRCDYLDEKMNKRTKRVIFPATTLVENNRVWIYSGSADYKIKYRTTSEAWLYAELNQSNNRI